MQWLNKVDDALDRVFLRPGGPAPSADDNAVSRGEPNSSANNDDSSSSLQVVGQSSEGGALSSGGDNRDGTRKVLRPPPPPPPPVASESITGPSSFTTTEAVHIDDRYLMPRIDNAKPDLDLNDRQITSSEEKLQSLANMMQQLEKEAKHTGRSDIVQNRSSDEFDNQNVNIQENTANKASISLLPMRSIEVTQNVNPQMRPSPPPYEQQSNKRLQTQQMQTRNTKARPPPPPPPPLPSPQKLPGSISITHTQKPNQSWKPTTPRLPQHTPSPLPTPRMTPRTPVRATPGIIRRKIRSPSVSPSNNSVCSTHSLEDVDLCERDDVKGVPPPPFVGDSSDAVSATVTGVKVLQQSDGKISLTPDNVSIPKQSADAGLITNPVSKEATMTFNQIQNADTIVRRNIIEEDKPATNTLNNLFETPKHNASNIECDDDSSSTTFHSQISNRSDLTDEENEDADSTEQQAKDFSLSFPESSSIKSWDPSFNCYGIVHVRVLRAQRLPCSPGTSVVASLALPPWKGKIRIPAQAAFDGPDGADVCIRWDKPTKKVTGRGSVAEDTDAQHFHSMVHAYNNKETPIPIVSLVLSTSSLGGVLEKFLCSVAFSCQDIMKNPGVWTSNWHSANLDPVTGSVDASSPSKQSSFLSSVRESTVYGEYDDEYNPLILIEASFEPKVEDPEQMISEDSDTLGPIPRDLVIRSSPERRLRHMPETVYSSIEDDSLSKTSSLTSVVARHHASKAHLLRVRSFWTPAWCAVCSKVITSGWLQGSFECEACHIFCCKDCQLQVDVTIPCGSELSRIAVKKAQQYQVSIGQVMTTLAPYSSKEKSDPKELKDNDDKFSQPNAKIKGIGIMSLKVLNACLFDNTYPSDTEPSDLFKRDSHNLRIGDHYVRVSWQGTKESKRTKTVLQTAKPVFDSDVMHFDVAHYGVEYKLEVVDANTDKAVGSCLLSPQALLQMHRDKLSRRFDQILLSLLHFRDESEPIRMKLELRYTTKDGFGLNYYNSTKITDDSKEKKSSSAVPGDISGWIEFDVNFQEDLDGLLYSSEPRRCPPRASEDFDIAIINLHIARISAIIEDVQKLASAYLYLISWENMHLTGLALVVFVVTTLRFNLEYLGALPVGMLVLYMLYLGQLRLSGHFKDRWIMKEKNALTESESKIDQQYKIHRPIGVLQIGNLQGKNLRSRDLGLPGSFYVSISFDPLRYASEKKSKSVSKIDASSSCAHQIGNTISPGITSSPRWTEVRPSEELTRLKHLLPDDQLLGDKVQSDDAEKLVKYPIPQPITKDRSLFLDMSEDEQRNTNIGLLPWDSSLGAVILQVRFSEVLGSFSLFENVLGEVVLPVAKLAGSGGRAVEGWFQLLGTGTTETAPGRSTDEIPERMPHGATEDSEIITNDNELDVPELYVKVKFATPSSSARQSTLEVETSRVICEEMVRTVSMSKEGNIGVMIGSSINTINTMRTLGGTLQNQLGNVVNTIEMIRNAFNFSSPRITCMIFFCLLALWAILALIPTRIVILLAGLSQYGATYYNKLIFVPKTSAKDDDDDDADVTAPGNVVENLFQSIPTDEDLRRTYFWEARRIGEREREKFANTKRQTRLKKLWKASWHGNVKVKERRPDSSYSESKRTWIWDTAFVLIEGHRFVWWRSEKHFDTGEAPLGQIFFAGHSGLAGLSPLDLRELSKEEIPLVVSAFGRGVKAQQKLTLLAPTQKVKDELENAVIAASSDRKAD